MRALLMVFICATTTIYGQDRPEEDLHKEFTERIGNFSIELLYHASKLQDKRQNLILSPISAWAVLAAISEGAALKTAKQINNAIRIKSRTGNRNWTRNSFKTISDWLQVNASAIELSKINAIFVAKQSLLEKDFLSVAEDVYKTRVQQFDFADGVKTANTINNYISTVTRGKIPKLVESSYFGDIRMILTSASYFKGQWSVPFSRSSTTRMPFHNSTGQAIGEVNMMYNRFTYPFAYIKELQGKVIELPYGKENRFSMLIMLPNFEVSIENMLLNLARMSLDKVFQALRVSKKEYGNDEVDCFIPRFRIESNLDLTNVLMKNFGIVDLFNATAARLPLMARTPLYASKVIHKAEIEVTEEGITASGVTGSKFASLIASGTFVANKPFYYLIIEKATNCIVFIGLYETPE